MPRSGPASIHNQRHALTVILCWRTFRCVPWRPQCSRRLFGDLGFGWRRAECALTGLRHCQPYRFGYSPIASAPRDLLIGSVAQGLALAMYLFRDGHRFISSPHCSAVQGLLVPSYAIIIRETIPAKHPRPARQYHGDGDRRVVRRMAPVVIFEMTGSYRRLSTPRIERAEHWDRLMFFFGRAPVAFA